MNNFLIHLTVNFISLVFVIRAGYKDNEAKRPNLELLCLYTEDGSKKSSKMYFIHGGVAWRGKKLFMEIYVH